MDEKKEQEQMELLKQEIDEYVKSRFKDKKLDKPGLRYLMKMCDIRRLTGSDIIDDVRNPNKLTVDQIKKLESNEDYVPPRVRNSWGGAWSGGMD